ncbi:hypothetical protein CR194_14630 [Salipaludibacillus keqinensis]|uniref:Uncharacterized protein n=1 Tax=Salipaludibacillus keqinensis TaxID=2045207 RepID=A0A323TDX3_9BACI|nr:hypothetical protein CR194_14630 [Salipaludibacillus keqinensis]
MNRMFFFFVTHAYPSLIIYLAFSKVFNHLFDGASSLIHIKNPDEGDVWIQNIENDLRNHGSPITLL